MTDFTPTNWRALCAELLLFAEQAGEIAANESLWPKCDPDCSMLDRTAAALSQPEPKMVYRYSPVTIAECGGPCEQGPQYCDCGEIKGEPESQPEPQEPISEVDDILRLAEIIREVDGNHDKSAAALAEAILSHSDSRWQHAQPEPQGPTDGEIEEAAKLIHASMRFAVPDNHYTRDWVERGNSLMQDEARRTARAVLARWGRPAIEPAAQEEAE